MRRRIKIMENVTINQKTASILESSSVGPATISDHEAHQIERANTTGLQPVVFVHGLWLLPSSWDRWATVFEEAGYTTLAPSWPDDPDTVEEANEHPEVFAHKTVGQVADHYAAIIGKLEKKPAVIGHSFGGLLSQMIAGRGLSAATVNVNPFTEAKADSKNPDRGPMLIISGEKDNTAPPAITNAIYKQQSRNVGVTETVLIPGRGHALVIDSGWREVCDISLAFVKRFVS